LLREVRDDHPVRPTLAAFDSETDHYPVGEVRDRWNSEAIKGLDAELVDYIQRIRPHLEEALQVLDQELD